MNDQPTEAKIPTAPSALERWLPMFVWLREYQWKQLFVADLVAALSVAALLIPESIGYASVAGVPAEVGLYAAPLALLAYAVLGGSKVLVVAAAGAVAAISASIVGDLGGGDADQAIVLSSALALTTGAVFVTAGLLRMGWIANFMSKAVMAGFVLGMSIQIIVGQLGKLFGIDLGDGNTFEKLWTIFTDRADWSGTAMLLGFGSLLLIVLIGRNAAAVPAALSAVVISSILVAMLDPDVELVAEIPQGLPTPQLPSGISGSDWLTLLLGGCLVALIGFSEGWGASAAISQKTGDELDTNQEFRATGVSNIGAGIMGGMVVSGSLSKSAAAMSSGARTQMSNVVLAALVLLTLLILAPAFQWLPEAALGAVVISAMSESANPAKVLRLRRQAPVEFGFGLFTFGCVLVFDLLPAMIAGIVLSIIYLVYRVSFPGRAIVGRIEETGDYESIRWIAGGRDGVGHSDAAPVPGILIYRLAAPLIFSNAEAFKQTGKTLVIEAAGEDRLPHTMIVDCEEISFIDTTGAQALRDLHRYLDQFGIGLRLARLHSEVYDLIRLDGVGPDTGAVPRDATIRDAVAASSRPDT